MSDGTDVIYLYDGTFDGLMSAVFEIYRDRCFPSSIDVTNNGQQSFCDDYRHIVTNRANLLMCDKEVIEV